MGVNWVGRICLFVWIPKGQDLSCLFVYWSCEAAILHPLDSTKRDNIRRIDWTYISLLVSVGDQRANALAHRKLVDRIKLKHLSKHYRMAPGYSSPARIVPSFLVLQSLWYPVLMLRKVNSYTPISRNLKICHREDEAWRVRQRSVVLAIRR